MTSNKLLRLLAERQPDLRLRERDLFFHLHHWHYLSQRFSARQRIESVLAHYSYEASRYGLSFRAQVHHDRGIVLWQSVSEEVEFCIRLIPGNSTRWRWEGELCVALTVNGTTLTVMSFSYVNADVFGLPPAPILFITRNQSYRETAEQTLFRSAFKQTTPPYFCLAALSGVAAANGMSRMAAIGHDAHISVGLDNEATLKNSYDEFWRAFHATELDKYTFLLSVPMEMTPISEVRAKHRNRARARRDAWAEVTASASRAMVKHLREPIRIAHCLTSAWMLLPLLGA